MTVMEMVGDVGGSGVITDVGGRGVGWWVVISHNPNPLYYYPQRFYNYHLAPLQDMIRSIPRPAQCAVQKYEGATPFMLTSHNICNHTIFF